MRVALVINRAARRRALGLPALDAGAAADAISDGRTRDTVSPGATRHCTISASVRPSPTSGRSACYVISIPARLQRRIETAGWRRSLGAHVQSRGCAGASRMRSASGRYWPCAGRRGALGRAVKLAGAGLTKFADGESVGPLPVRIEAAPGSLSVRTPC